MTFFVQGRAQIICNLANGYYRPFFSRQFAFWADKRVWYVKAEETRPAEEISLRKVIERQNTRLRTGLSNLEDVSLRKIMERQTVLESQFEKLAKQNEKQNEKLETLHNDIQALLRRDPRADVPSTSPGRSSRERNKKRRCISILDECNCRVRKHTLLDYRTIRGDT